MRNVIDDGITTGSTESSAINPFRTDHSGNVRLQFTDAGLVGDQIWISVAAFALVLTGCGGSTGGSSGGGGGGDSDGVTLTSTAMAIFETQCADCHGAGGQGGSAPNLVTNESSLSELEANRRRPLHRNPLTRERAPPH